MEDTTKKMYLVMGHMNTGSGSLTYPEDFDVVGVYDNRGDAQSDCDRRNKEMLEGKEDDDGDPITNLDDLLCDDDMIYEVDEVPVLTKETT